MRRKGHTATETFLAKSAAQGWGRKVEREIDLGTYAPNAERRTLRELVLAYTNREPRGGGRTGGNATFSTKLSEVEQEKRRKQLGWWVDRIGHLQLGRVTSGVVTDQLDTLAEGDGPSGQAASAATQNRYRAALQAAFSFAEVKGW